MTNIVQRRSVWTKSGHSSGLVPGRSGYTALGPQSTAADGHHLSDPLFGIQAPGKSKVLGLCRKVG